MGAIFAAPLGVHMVHLAQVQGEAGAFVTRQAMWDNAFPYPFKALAGFFVFPRRLSGWVHGAFWFLYVGLLVRYWRKLPLGEALFCAARAGDLDAAGNVSRNLSLRHGARADDAGAR